jgi:hypothetical protein
VVVGGRSLVADLVGDSAMWQSGGRDGLMKCHAPVRAVLLNLTVTRNDKVVNLLTNLNTSTEPFLSVSDRLLIVRDGP